MDLPPEIWNALLKGANGLTLVLCIITWKINDEVNNLKTRVAVLESKTK